MAEHSPSNTVDREVSKEAFHHVEPRGARGSKVKVKPGIAPLPCHNLFMLMGRIVVADNMNFLVGGRAFADQIQKADPLLMTVLVHASSNDGSVSRIHGGEE